MSGFLIFKQKIKPIEALSFAFILFGWTSPISAVFLIFSLAFFLGISRLLHRGKGFSLTKIDLMIFIYLTLAFIPTVLYHSYEAFFKTCFYPFFIYWVFATVPFQEKSLKWVLVCIFLSSGFMIFLMYFQVSPGQFDFSFNHLITKPRWMGYWYLDPYETVGPTTISSLVVCSLLLILSYLFYTNKNKSNLLVGIAIFLFCVNLFILIKAGSRTSLVSSIASIVTLAYMTFSVGRLKRFVMESFVLTVVIFLMIYLFNYLIEIGVSETFDRVRLFIEDPTDMSALGSRMFLWQNALFYVGNNPLGLGMDFAVVKFGMTLHNEFLAQALGAGWLGLLLFLLIWVTLTVRTFELAVYSIGDIHTFSSFVSALCVVALFAALTENFSKSSSNIFHPIIWICFGIISHFYSVRRPKQNN